MTSAKLCCFSSEYNELIFFHDFIFSCSSFLFESDQDVIFTKLFVFRSSRFSGQGAGEGGEGQEAQGGAGGRQEEEARGAQAAREL